MLCCVWILARVRSPRLLVVTVSFLVLAVSWGFLVAGIVGNSILRTVLEGQLLVDLTCGIIVGYGVIRLGLVRRMGLATGVVLWVSLLLLTASSFSLISVTGVAEEASLGDAASNAVRLLTPTVFVALAAACLMIARLILGMADCVRWAVVLLMPSIGILLLAFSRNSVVGIGVAAAMALLCHRRALSGLLRICLIVGAASALLFSAVQVGGAFGAGEWTSLQIGAYEARVISGLAPESLAADPSAQYRVLENENAWAAIKKSPIVGAGLGAAYQEPRGPRGTFGGEIEPYYAHNFWLWVWLKLGLLGISAFLFAFVVPIQRCFD